MTLRTSILTLLLLAAPLAAWQAPLPPADASAPMDPPRFWPDRPKYEWIGAAPSVQPIVCLNVQNVDADQRMTLLTSAPYTIHDHMGHLVLTPTHLTSGVHLAPGETYRMCAQVHSQEDASDAMAHDARWAVLSQAMFAPPGQYTVRLAYQDEDRRRHLATTTFDLVEVVEP